MGAASAVWWRARSDLLLPDRLGEYRALLEHALAQGYAAHTLRSFRDLLDAGRREERVLVLRRDVDTDPATARAMSEVDHDVGVRATSFFRLRTVDVALMRDLEAAGSEAGYHFEEVATVARELRLRDRAEAERRLPLARERFRRNLLALRERTGLALDAVASHGDVLNRRLGIDNRALLTPGLRAELGIRTEAYDREVYVRAAPRSRFIDAPPPVRWRPGDPHAAIDRGEPVVYLLTHPRQWRRNVRATMRENLDRAWTGARFARWPGGGG
jgi:hypothetical protein